MARCRLTGARRPGAWHSCSAGAGSRHAAPGTKTHIPPRPPPPGPLPAGPLSQVGEAALNDNRSFYGHDSALQSSDDGGSAGEAGSRGAGAGSSTESEAGSAAAAARQDSVVGSVLDIEGRSDDE